MSLGASRSRDTGRMSWRGRCCGADRVVGMEAEVGSEGLGNGYRHQCWDAESN
jgi:hypothetical protein